MHEKRIDTVEVRVDEKRRPTAQVHVLFPPIRYVVRRPPGKLEYFDTNSKTKVDVAFYSRTLTTI